MFKICCHNVWCGGPLGPLTPFFIYRLPYPVLSRVLSRDSNLCLFDNYVLYVGHEDNIYYFCCVFFLSLSLTKIYENNTVNVSINDSDNAFRLRQLFVGGIEVVLFMTNNARPVQPGCGGMSRLTRDRTAEPVS